MLLTYSCSVQLGSHRQGGMSTNRTRSKHDMIEHAPVGLPDLREGLRVQPGPEAKSLWVAEVAARLGRSPWPAAPRLYLAAAAQDSKGTGASQADAPYAA